MSSLRLGGPNCSYFSVSHHMSQLLIKDFLFLLGGQGFCLFLTDREKMDLTMALDSLSPYLQPPALFKNLAY